MKKHKKLIIAFIVIVLIVLIVIFFMIKNKKTKSFEEIQEGKGQFMKEDRNRDNIKDFGQTLENGADQTDKQTKKRLP